MYKQFHRVSSEQDRVDHQLDRFFQTSQNQEKSKQLLDLSPYYHDINFLNLLKHIFQYSPFLSKNLIDYPDIIYSISEVGLQSTYEKLKAEWPDQVDHFSISELKQALRIAKNKLALLVGIAEISSIWSLEKTTHALSDFADYSLQVTLEYLMRQSQEKYKLNEAIFDAFQQRSGVAIIAMGKLGSRELNYSSDIDIILLYDPDKLYADKKQKPLAQKHMISITKKLVDILQEKTKDGHVFRVDLRLRPDPYSTPVAVNIHSAIEYYFTVGQNWERAAMIKARAAAGDLKLGKKFLKNIQPYIWREYLDFWMIRDTHAMKRQINAHYQLRGVSLLGHNIKLGQGGIREIEFFIQTEQLIWGGKNSKLRPKETCKAFDAFTKAKLMQPYIGTKLKKAYRFLRKVEHHLQMINDIQTHKLPSNEEEFTNFAHFMGYKSSEGLMRRLKNESKAVRQYYAGRFEQKYPLNYEGNLVFTGVEKDPETKKTLSHLGFKNPDTIQNIIPFWHHGHYASTKSGRARQLLTDLIPILLDKMSKTSDPDRAFINFDEFLKQFEEGEYFFSLLHANTNILDLFIQILGSSPRLAEHITNNIKLFDVIADPNFLSGPFTKKNYQKLLEEALKFNHSFDDKITAINQFKKEQKFIIGTLFFRKEMNLQKAVKAYSDIAEIIMINIHQLVEAEFARTYGRLNPSRKYELTILSYGKFGAKEMTPSSDIDITFLCFDKSEEAKSNGKIELFEKQYITKLVKFFISTVERTSPKDMIYALDLRLRPYGESAPIVSSLSAWKDYIENHAWRWEIMALLRARVISGSEILKTKIDAFLNKTLNKKHDVQALKDEIKSILSKIKQNYESALLPIEKRFALKYPSGGILETEFLIQYIALINAHKFPDLLDTNTHKLVKNLIQEKILTKQVGKTLQKTHEFWLILQTFQRLTSYKPIKPEDMPDELKKILCFLTNSVDFDDLQAKIKSNAEFIRKLYHTYIDDKT